MTVAALRGSAGTRSPDNTARADSPSSPGSRMEAAFTASSATLPPAPFARGLVPDLNDQLDLDRGIERQGSRADRAPRVPSGFAEDLEQQFAGPVDDLRL